MSKTKKYNLIFLCLAIVFFLLYSYTALATWLPNWLTFKHLIFNWPDANANYFFAQLFADTGSFRLVEILNGIGENIIHTRSMNIVDLYMVPVTFLPALTIFSLGFKLLGGVGILFLTPLLATLTVYFVYRLAIYLFDIDLAFLIALLLFPLAPWLYFSNVVMLPTILFIFLLVAGFLSFAKYVQKQTWWYWLLTSLLLSLAILVRPTEILWVSILIIFVFILNRRYLNWQNIVSAVVTFGFLGWVALWLNKLTYGGYFSIGYLSFEGGSNELGQSNTLNPLKLLIAPFGFDLWLIIKNFYKYFFEIVVVHFILAIAGVVYLLSKRKVDRVWKYYFIVAKIISILILIYYGSWYLADPLVLELNKISISYVRYFLPLYILILPLTALALRNIFWRQKKIKWLAPVIILFLTVISLKVAFYSTNDGLFATQRTLRTYYTQYRLVSERVEEDSIIISERSDKVFWPKYRVIVREDGGRIPFWMRVYRITKNNNIYYYADLSRLEEEKEAAKLRSLELEEIAVMGFDGHEIGNRILLKVKRYE